MKVKKINFKPIFFAIIIFFIFAGTRPIAAEEEAMAKVRGGPSIEEMRKAVGKPTTKADSGGTGMLVVSHERSRISDWCDRVIDLGELSGLAAADGIAS